MTGRMAAKARRMFSAFRYDMVFQWRHGFYIVYVIIVTLYVFALRALPADWKEVTAVLLVFSDTSVLGFFFIGGIVLLERSQNTFESLFITPLRIHEYFIAKVASLTLIAILMSFIVVLAGFGISVNLLPLFLSVSLCSIFFTLAGITVASRVRSVNGYFGAAIPLILIAMPPVAGYFGFVNDLVFIAFPTHAALVLLEGAFRNLPVLRLAGAAAVLCGWIAGVYLLASRWFRKYVLVEIGEEKWKIV